MTQGFKRYVYGVVKAFRRIFALVTALQVFVWPIQAHPHVFVDGGVDFVFNDKGLLEALYITWLYDEFETLYILSSYDMSLNAAGGLDEKDRQRLIRLRRDWPSDFDGSAHLSIGGADVELKLPAGLDVQFVDGRLQITFTRQLETVIDLSRSSGEVAFYESTYFYAFAVTNTPQLLGHAMSCETEVIPFDPDAQDVALQAALTKLSREETPDIDQVGARFADRISIRCV